MALYLPDARDEALPYERRRTWLVFLGRVWCGVGILIGEPARGTWRPARELEDLPAPVLAALDEGW